MAELIPLQLTVNLQGELVGLKSLFFTLCYQVYQNVTDSGGNGGWKASNRSYGLLAMAYQGDRNACGRTP